MKKNYIMWLLGGAALYFLTRKKETTGPGPAARPEDVDLSPTTSAPAPGNVAPGPGGSTGGPILETNQSYTFSA
jgi:hypothetical protein